MKLRIAFFAMRAPHLQAWNFERQVAWLFIGPVRLRGGAHK
jgi:hypothetical protein